MLEPAGETAAEPVAEQHVYSPEDGPEGHGR